MIPYQRSHFILEQVVNIRSGMLLQQKSFIQQVSFFSSILRQVELTQMSVKKKKKSVNLSLTSSKPLLDLETLSFFPSNRHSELLIFNADFSLLCALPCPFSV